MNEKALSPALYLIPTPLGEEGFAGALTAPALDIVRQLRLFAVENVRTARRFLSPLGMPVPIDTLEFILFNRDSTDSEAQQIALRIIGGIPVGVLSEAGAPGVADPGARLVAMAHTMNIDVEPLVGASSILLALMASGFNGQSFAFNGYLPIEQRALRSAIVRLEHIAITTNQTQLFIETPYRNDRLLSVLLSTLRDSTLLTIARGLNTSSHLVRTQSVAEWKAHKPTIGKIPTVFIVGVAS